VRFLSEVSPVSKFFPLYALARFRNQSEDAGEFCALKFQPAEFRLRSGF
jgi:hypothetical protein